MSGLVAASCRELHKMRSANEIEQAEPNITQRAQLGVMNARTLSASRPAPTKQHMRPERRPLAMRIQQKSGAERHLKLSK